MAGEGDLFDPTHWAATYSKNTKKNITWDPEAKKFIRTFERKAFTRKIKGGKWKSLKNIPLPNSKQWRKENRLQLAALRQHINSHRGANNQARFYTVKGKK